MNSVAICIPTYNQADYLAEAVNSAFSQSSSGTEVWLSDDASTDHTPARVAELAFVYPSLKMFRQETNLGMSGNPRWVVRQPQSEFIVKLDSDDRLHSEFVDKLAALMYAYPKAGYAHCSVNQINDQGVQTRTRRLSRRTGFQDADASLQVSVTGYGVAANICMFRREALAAVDYYKPDMGFCDDWDLAVRIADAGWGNVYCEEVLASYRVWDGADSGRARRQVAEMNGARRVYEEALLPAYRKRNWDVSPVLDARRKRALSYSDTLASPALSNTEREQIVDAMRGLGNSAELDRRLMMYRMGFGPLFQLRRKWTMQAKDAVKGLLHSGSS